MRNAVSVGDRKNRLGEARNGTYCVKRDDRQQTTFAEQRHELVGRDGEPDEVHRRQAALEQEARVPVSHLTIVAICDYVIVKRNHESRITSRI